WQKGLALVLAGWLILGGSPVRGGRAAAEAAETDGTKQAEAAVTLPGINWEELDQFFSWVYTTAGLPENVTPREMTLAVSSLSGDPIDGAEAVFLEGDEKLREAVTVSADGKVSIDNTLLTEAGTARFRLSFQTAGETFEQEETLTVLDYAETPSPTELYVDPVFYMEPGQQFTSQQALNAIVREEYASYCLVSGFALPAAELTVEPRALSGMSWDEEKDLYTVDEFGMYDLKILRSIGNLTWTLPFQVQATAYSITGPAWLMPGQTGQYRVTDVDAAAGRTYRWSVSGNEAEIGEKTGVLTVSREAATGMPLTLVLTPEPGAAIKTQIRIVDGALSGLTETTAEPEAGFQVPVPSGDAWETHVSEKRENGWIYRSYGTGAEGASLIIEARTDPITSGFREDDQAALAYYDETVFNEKARNLQTETLRIDGHYARLYTYTTDGQNQQVYRMGEIAYCRNNRLLTLNVYATGTGVPEDSLIPVTMKDLHLLAEMIHYDPDQAPVKQADTRLTVTAQDETEELGAGRSVWMTARYAGENLGQTPEEKAFRWTVTDAESGGETQAASITSDGRLTAAAGLTRTTEVVVTAVSEAFGTKASRRMRLIPVSKGISIDSGDLMLYVGAAEATTVRAVMIPEEMPAEGLFWRTTRPNLFEVTDMKDGSVQVRALGTGNGYLSVREPGGKAAQIALKAAIPVETVQLTWSGSARPGRSMNFSAKLLPLNAGIRTVRWSVDVDEKTARINRKGRLTIQPGVAAGTVIKVTCTADGAPVPVTATAEITVK
ncbi:MAG: hypothetical protein J6U01_00375, partial [Clostridia bacterium]|nr:hypothetical protein [Clostridia bacterium]